MRVISLLASGTEILCGMGAGHLLVGRSHECDMPQWVRRLPSCTRPAFDVNLSSGEIDAEVRRRLSAGEPLYHIDTHRIHRLKPDLLITQAHCPVCAVTPGDVADSGCSIGAQVLALTVGTVAGIYEGVREIARAVGREQAGESLVGSMRTRIEQVSAAVAARRPPSVVVLEWIDPIFALGNWGPELVEAANGHPLLARRGQHSCAIPWQRVRDADPDFLVIAPCGFGLDRTRREAQTLQTLPGWEGNSLVLSHQFLSRFRFFSCISPEVA